MKWYERDGSPVCGTTSSTRPSRMQMRPPYELSPLTAEPIEHDIWALVHTNEAQHTAKTRTDETRGDQGVRGTDHD